MAADREKAMAKVLAAYNAYVKQNPSLAKGELEYFDSDIMLRSRLVDASLAGTVTYEIELGREHGNAGGEMFSEVENSCGVCVCVCV